MADIEKTHHSGSSYTEDLDGRSIGEWVSRWRNQPVAWRQIKAEVAFLAALLLLLPAGLVAVYLRWPNYLLSLDSARYTTLAAFGYAWLGGTYGGTLLDTKWLYHGVAKGSWNSDRLIWRLFIPFLSGGVSVAVFSLVISGLLPLIDVSRLRNSPAVLGLSILTGYFSDNAIAALARLADRLFGTLDKASPHEPPRPGAAVDRNTKPDHQ